MTHGLFPSCLVTNPKEVLIMTSSDRLQNVSVTPLQQIISSSVGAMLTALAVTPLDVVKTRLQTQQKDIIQSKERNIPYRTSMHLNGTMDALVKLTRHEGITSLWSGLPPTLVMALPQTVLYFTMYDQLSTRLRANLYRNDLEKGTWIPLVAGGTARTIAAIAMSPLEMVRTKMQSKKLSYRQIGTAVRQLVKSEGIFSLWLGLSATIYRDVPFSCLYWWNYENIKRYFHQPNPTIGLSLGAGAVSGSIAAVVTLPFDVVKTHRQIELGDGEPKKMLTTGQIMMQIYRERGIRGLFTGLAPRVMRVAPACAIMITTYEWCKAHFRKKNLAKLEAKKL